MSSYAAQSVIGTRASVFGGSAAAAWRGYRRLGPGREERANEQAVRAEGRMSIFNFFSRPRSAPVARERLQLLLAHERALNGRSDLAAVLQEEILAVIARHIAIDRDKVNVKLDRGGSVSTLEIDIEMPVSLSPVKN